MKHALLTVIFVAGFANFAAAQNASSFNANLDIVDEPICFAIKNEADYTVLGNFTTADYMRPSDGVITNHRSNFRLAPGEGEEFCSYGPFLPDRSLRMTLRTLFPVFECETRVDSGTITIRGERRADDSGVVTWAECIKADGSITGKP